MSAAQFVARLEGAKKNGHGWEARCPAHEDGRASLSVSEGEDGRVLLRCHAGCDVRAVVAALGISERDLFPAREERTDRGRIVDTYDYTDEAGELLYQVVRFEPKDFRQRRPDGAGDQIWSLGAVRRVLFRLPRVVEAARKGRVVFVVEGEKDVLALEAFGLVATCNPGGAGKWRADFSASVAGVRGAVVIPDRDAPGEKHARAVAASLHAARVPVKLLELPGAKDAAEWIAAGGTKAALLALSQRAPLWRPANEPDNRPDNDLAPAVLVRVADVQPERVSWLWMHRIPLGKVTVLDGDPGLGKSTLTLDLAARVSRGAPMPGESKQRAPAGVVLLSGEDGLADTIRPRLEAAGADLERVVVLTAVRDAEGRLQLPSIPGDVEAIRRAVRDVGAKLLVVDPLMAFLAGKVDSHRDQDVRGALALVSSLGEDTGAAVVIVRHLNKTQGGHPLYRGGGSIGIIGAARAGLLVAPDPKDQSRRILAMSKSNLGPIPPSLAYRLAPAGETSAVSWEGETSETARDLLAAQREDGESGGASEEAEVFLRELLADGAVPVKDAQRQAREAGIAERTLDRAKARLGVRARKEGRPGERGGRWLWLLPEGCQEPPKSANPQSWHPSGEVGILRDPELPAGPPEEEIIS